MGLSASTPSQPEHLWPAQVTLAPNLRRPVWDTLEQGCSPCGWGRVEMSCTEN